MKYYKNAALALALTLSIGTAVFAETATLRATTSAEVKLRAGEGRGQNDERRMEVKEKIQDRRGVGSSTCMMLEKRIDTRLSSFGEKYGKHKRIYDVHREKLLAISAKLKAEGFATATLEANIALLDTKIAEFEADHAKVRTALEAAKSKSCADGSGEFKTAVEAVRAAQNEVAEDARDIFQFIKGTLKEDVMELRAAFKAKI